MSEAAVKGLDRRELFKRLMGRKVELTTNCKSFDRSVGTIKEVFDDFLMFITQKETAGYVEQFRHWILFDSISYVTETPKVPTEDVEITR